MNLLIDSNERHVVVKDDTTKSGYRDCASFSRNLGKFDYLVQSPDVESGYILIHRQYDEIYIYEVVAIFKTTKEATDFIHNNRKDKKLKPLENYERDAILQLRIATTNLKGE